MRLLEHRPIWVVAFAGLLLPLIANCSSSNRRVIGGNSSSHARNASVAGTSTEPGSVAFLTTKDTSTSVQHHLWLSVVGSKRTISFVGELEVFHKIENRWEVLTNIFRNESAQTTDLRWILENQRGTWKLEAIPSQIAVAPLFFNSTAMTVAAIENLSLGLVARLVGESNVIAPVYQRVGDQTISIPSPVFLVRSSTTANDVQGEVSASVLTGYTLTISKSKLGKIGKVWSSVNRSSEDLCHLSLQKTAQDTIHLIPVTIATSGLSDLVLPNNPLVRSELGRVASGKIEKGEIICAPKPSGDAVVTPYTKTTIEGTIRLTS